MSTNHQPKKPAPRRLPHTHQIRIIGGQWKRTVLPVPDAAGLRPTPDRVRETVFNWLNHLLDGAWANTACLDLFAGTGALGFEAASRGAARVVMVEASVPAVRQLEATKEKLHAERVSVVRGDALSTAQRLAAGTDAGRFDLIFLDPPYHQDWLAKTLPVCARLLTEGGLVYAESEMSLTPEIAPADKAGMVFYHLLRCKKQADFQA
jgi:16S rRNA (guanine966-N2)-methyltransferase